MASADKTNTKSGGTKNSLIDPLYQKFTKSVVRALGTTEFYEFFMDSIAHAQNRIQFSNRKLIKTVDTTNPRLLPYILSSCWNDKSFEKFSSLMLKLFFKISLSSIITP